MPTSPAKPRIDPRGPRFGAAITAVLLLLVIFLSLTGAYVAAIVLLAGVAGSRPGVAHLDVDLTHRADLAHRFGVMQTPTTLILDGAGRVRFRIGGVPHRAGVARHLDDLTGSTHAHLAR